MSLDAKGAAALALHRFGLGPRTGLDRGDRLRSARRAARRTGEARHRPDRRCEHADGRRRPHALAFSYNQEQQAKRIAARVSAEQQKTTMAVMNPADDPKPDDANTMAVPDPAAPPQPIRRSKITTARSRRALTRRSMPRSALSSGWCGSGRTISASRPTRCRAWPAATSARRSAPHVLGRFADMLLAAESHPAMLFYLDNARSIGPNSVAGINRRRGLNENLAREILELHTLGVRTGYTQDDVTSFAKVLTGWTIMRPMRPIRSTAANSCSSAHARARAADRARQELSRRPASSRAAPCSPISRAIRRRPRTSRSSSRAISSPTSRRRRWSSGWRRRFRDTDGDLKEMAQGAGRRAGGLGRAAQQAEAAGRMDHRGVARDRRSAADDRSACSQRMRLLGEPLWRPPAPKGFSDEEAAWLDGLAQRLDIANTFAQPGRGRRRSAGAGRRASLGSARVGGDAASRRARRKPAAGAGAAADGARIPAEVMP